MYKLNIILLIILFFSLGIIIYDCIEEYKDYKICKKLYKFIDDEVDE